MYQVTIMSSLLGSHARFSIHIKEPNDIEWVNLTLQKTQQLPTSDKPPTVVWEENHDRLIQNI